jgi:CheY-like chemotaxis protein
VKDLLIIEPDPSQALGIRVALQTHFRNIWIASSIPEAVRVLSHMSFHIILSEFSFPLMDGYAALDQLHAGSHGAQLILMTATPPKLAKSELEALNIQAVIEKPVDLQTLKSHLIS